MAIQRRALLIAALCVPLVWAALYLLAFGTAVFCCAPSPHGTGFWHRERLSYGLLPIAIAVGMLAVAIRLWAHSFARRRNAWLIGSLAAVPLIATVGLLAFRELRASADEGIELEWNSELRAFSWGRGKVTIPTGFTYTRESGIDTAVGYFTSDNSSVIIRYDIGELAGEHGGLGGSETTIEGSRVRSGRAKYIDDQGTTKYFAKVSFTDAGCANFSISSANEQDLAAIELVATSFRPTGSMPPWLRPLLPEVLRSDCRYRFRLPEEVATLATRFLDRVFPP